MADAIRVNMVPDTLEVLPDGDPVEVVVTIQNTGMAVDQYAVELDGLPTTWYSLSSASVALFPQDREESKLVIHPPKGKGNGVKAGTYPFTVTVLSRADSSQTTRAEGTLQIGAVAAFELDMSPKKVIGRKGRYTVTMRNGGNADLDVALDATDAEDACRFRFKPQELQLSAGQQAKAQVTVRPRRSGWVGVKKAFDFQLKATPSRGDVKTMQGQLVHTPRLRTWKPIRRLAQLFIAVAVLFLAFVTPGTARQPAQQLWHRIDTATCQRLSLFCPAIAHTAHGRYVTAFKRFHQHDPRRIGAPLENEHGGNGGFTTQRTTNGLLVYDPQDGHSFFIPNGTQVYEYDHGHERALK